MAINKRLIATEVGGGGAACTTDTLQILGDSSCIAYYKMSDATDESGSYNGTPSNVNFNVAGKFGNAGEFNGASSNGSEISIADANVFSPVNNNLSFSCWIKTTVGDTYIASKLDDGGGSYEWGFFTNTNGTIQILCHSSGGSGTAATVASSQTTALDGNWNQVGFVIDYGNSVTVYVNGVGTTSTSWSGIMTNTSVPVLLGAATNIPAARMLGSIDQVRIFNKALSSTEVTTLYNEVQCIPTIIPSEHFNPVLYTGNGGTQAITNVGFQPDLSIIKTRSNVDGHFVFDSIRGVRNAIQTNSTTDTFNRAALTDFNSNGFTLGNYAGTNTSSYTYVAWNWYAPTSETNNAGSNGASIASTIKKNVDAGFSIVSYTGNGTAGATISHGLSFAPQLILVKILNQANNWAVYNQDIGNANGFRLNSSSAAFSAGTSDGTNNYWNSTSPTSTVFTVGNGHSTNQSSSYNYIAYCFHSVESYSRIGSYIGDRTNDVFVVTGFEPAWVMIKAADASDNWFIVDNKREGSSAPSKVLLADESAAESNFVDGVRFTTNGFQLVGSANSGGTNNDGTKFIFMAFAQDPDTTPATEANSFEAKTYTGNGGTQSITLSNGMKPDFSWVKDRDSNESHQLANSVIGVPGTLNTNGTGGLYVDSTYQWRSFDDNGFTVKDNTPGHYGVNGNGIDYISWNWKAADHDRDLATINQDGSITSLVSANQASGFSIVKYNVGTQSNSQTIGHGLESPPEIIIDKVINSGGYGWTVYTQPTGLENALTLNSTGAVSSYADFCSVVNDSIFQSKYTSASNTQHIAYCFTSITSYQKIGSYSGGSTNTIVTGFQPRFLMVKKTNESGTGWYMFDNARNPSNPRDLTLFANSSAAESVQGSFYQPSFLSNGFSFPVANGSGVNISGGEYIYLAIA